MIGIVIVLFLIIVGFFIFNNESDLYSEEINQEERNYVSRNVEECSRTQILCVEGLTYFSDETGCGCEGEDIEGQIFEEEQKDKNCEGGKFNYPPVNLDKTKLAVPLGLMSGSHVTPIDHMYFQDFSNNEANIEVYSPAEGIVTEMQYMFGSRFTEKGEINWEDYRVTIEHNCGISSYYIHIDKLSDKLKKVSPSKGENSYPKIKVEEGEILGWYQNNVDYNIVDQNILLDGLLITKHYDREPWKVHTPSDQYNYFNDEIKSKLIKKSLRHESPYSGKFDWDVDGTLQGNWFVEGSNWYGGIDGEVYWDTHLSFSPDYLDYNHFIVSMGDFDGQQEQFGAKGNEPNPLEVSIETGIVTYELVNFDFITENGESWDKQSLEIIKEVKNFEQVFGTVLVQMVEDRKIKFETFPGKAASQVSGFTENVKIYIR